jgi:glycosyltransferase involved in cell wall biosynthesis
VDGETGLLVSPGDPQALRQAIERLLADAESREQMGRAGRRRSAIYQAAAVVPRIEGVYAGLLAKPLETNETTPTRQHHYHQL